MNIQELSVTELKALAYDQLGTIEVSQLNLKAINEELQKRQNEQQAIQDQPE